MDGDYRHPASGGVRKKSGPDGDDGNDWGELDTSQTSSYGDSEVKRLRISGHTIYRLLNHNIFTSVYAE